MFRYPAKATHARYGSMSRPALRSMCQKSTVHIKISIHIPTSQINAVRYISSEKNIIDQKKFIPNCKA